jgi:hypothetical protein
VLLSSRAQASFVLALLLALSLAPRIGAQEVQHRVFADDVVPPIPAVSDGVPIEVGVKLRSSVAGEIRGLRFYKGAANTGVPDEMSDYLTQLQVGRSEDHGCWSWTGTDVHINGNDCTVDGYFVPGGLVVYGARAVVKNTRVHNTVGGAYPNNVNNHFVTQINWTWNGASLTFQDSEMAGSEYCIGGYGFTILRSELASCNHLVQAVGPNIVVRDSWLHGLVGTPDAHSDNIQSVGSSGMQVIHNTIEMGEVPGKVAVLSLGDSTGCGTVVDGNWLNGGAWTVLVDTATGCPTQVTNNRFGRDYVFSPGRIVTPIVQSGNVWDDTGAPVVL